MRTRYTGLLAAAVFMARCAGQEAERFPEWQPAPLGWAELWERSPKYRNRRSPERPPVWRSESSQPALAGRVGQADLLVRRRIRHALSNPRRAPFAREEVLMGIRLSGLCAAIIRKGLRPGPPHHSTLVHTAGEGIRPPSVRHGFALRFPRNVGRTVEPQPSGQLCVAATQPARQWSDRERICGELFWHGRRSVLALPKTGCTKQVARLAALGDADLRAAACHFLAYEFREECSPQRAPGKEP